MILGDIIETVNDRPVASFDDLRNELDRYKVGDNVTLGIVRDKERVTVTVRLEEVE